MIVETSDGAILELFWRRRGATPWSHTRALHFLSQYTVDRMSLQGIRWLLSDRADTARTWQSSNAAMLERAASLIATDRVVVAEFGGTERWPGSGFILGSGSDSSLLFWSDRLHIHRDVDRAQQWLREMQELNARALKQKEKKLSKDDELAVRENRRHIASLRSLISSNADVPQYVNLSDHDFLQLVINFLKDGDLLPIYHRYPGIADPGPTSHRMVLHRR